MRSITQNKNFQPPMQRLNEQDILGKDFFTYSAVFTSLAQNTNRTLNIPIQADSDFVLQKLCFFADNNVAGGYTPNTRFIPNVTCLLVDTGSGRQLSDAPVPLYTLFGTAENPFILPTPKVFSARSNIAITLANVELTAVTYNIRLALIGTKVFRNQ